MKRTLLFLFLITSVSGISQKWIDLANVYWRSSPLNDVEGSALQRNLNTFSANLKLPLVLNENNVFIIGLDYQDNSISIADNELDISPIQYYSSMIQLGWEHKWNEHSKMLFMSMTRLNTDFIEVSSSHFQQAGLVLGTKSKTDNFDWKYGCYYSGEFFSPMLVPLFGFNWKASEKWRLVVVVPVNIELSYFPNENLRMGLKYEGLNASYKISSDNSNSESYLDKADNNVWVFGEKQFGKNVWFHLKAGHSILRDYSIYGNTEKMDLKISAVGLGDERTATSMVLNDGWSFEMRLIYRLPL